MALCISRHEEWHIQRNRKRKTIISIYSSRRKRANKEANGRAIQQCPDFCFIFPKSKKEGGTRLKWEMTPHWRLCRGCPWTQGWTWKWVLDHQVMFIHEPVGFMSHKVGDALDRAPQASRFMFASSSSSPCVCAVYSSLFFSSLGSAQVFSRWYFY